MVKLVITSEFFGINENRNSIKKQIKSWGAANIDFTEDGFITAVMTESGFENFMVKIKDKMESALSEILNRYDCIKKIDHDNFYINFTVQGKNFEEFNLNKLVSEIYMTAVIYQIFNGIPQEETSVCVKFKNGKKIYDIINKGGL